VQSSRNLRNIRFLIVTSRIKSSEDSIFYSMIRVDHRVDLNERDEGIVLKSWKMTPLLMTPGKA
jgi:hypothetical protein